MNYKAEFLKFKDIPPIDISIHTNSKNNNELFLLLNSLFIIKKIIAKIAQLVEYNLAKVNVEGSSPFFRFYYLIIYIKWTQRQYLVFPYKYN